MFFLVFEALKASRILQIIFAAVAISLAFVAFKVHYIRQGQDAARQETIQQTLETARERIEVENTTRADPDPAGRLQREWSRP